MNISLDNHFERFVAEMVASGRFKSSHEVVREALRLLEEREIRFRRLTLEIKKGRASGAPVPFDSNVVKSRGRQSLHRRNSLC